MATGYWLCYPALDSGAGTRYPKGQLIEPILGDADQKPYLGDAQENGEPVYDCVWVSKDGLEDMAKRPLFLGKYDYVRPADAKIVDALGIEVDMTKRQFVSYQPEGEDEVIYLRHGLKRIDPRRGSEEHDALMASAEK